MWLRSLQSSPFAKPFSPNSSSISSQLSIFLSSLLFTTLQPLFPLLSHFSITIVSTSSQIDYSKFQLRFIFPRRLHSYYVFYFSFSFSLHYCYTCFHCSYLDNKSSKRPFLLIPSPISSTWKKNCYLFNTSLPFKVLTHLGRYQLN